MKYFPTYFSNLDISPFRRPLSPYRVSPISVPRNNPNLEKPCTLNQLTRSTLLMCDYTKRTVQSTYELKNSGLNIIGNKVIKEVRFLIPITTKLLS